MSYPVDPELLVLHAIIGFADSDAIAARAEQTGTQCCACCARPGSGWVRRLAGFADLDGWSRGRMRRTPARRRPRGGPRGDSVPATSSRSRRAPGESRDRVADQAHRRRPRSRPTGADDPAWDSRHRPRHRARPADEPSFGGARAVTTDAPTARARPCPQSRERKSDWIDRPTWIHRTVSFQLHEDLVTLGIDRRAEVNPE